MLQAQPDVADLIGADLLAALGHEIDAAALGASADANAPDGLRQSLAGSKVPFAGTVPTWAELLDMEQDVLDEDATDPAFVLSPVMARVLKEAETETGNGRHIMAGGKIADRSAVVISAMAASDVIVSAPCTQAPRCWAALW